MYAVVETGGKQLKVSQGDVVFVEKLKAEVGETVVLEKVLLVAGDDGVKVGQPLLTGAKVTAKVEGQGRDKKVVIFKYKSKKNYHKKQGHRQPFTKLRIESIEA